MQQVRNIEQAARQIHSATASWQAVQDDASKAVAAARELQDRMTAEGQSFQDFLQRANDSERTHLRLEVEKLRRAEGEWLQVLVRVLDQVWALYQAAVRSGKINLVEQLSHFQRACRDAAQRVGLVPFTAHNGDVLDPELHQLANAGDENRADAPIAETVATGFRYQGQIVRKALVLLQTAEAAEPPAPAPVDAGVEPAAESGPAEEAVEPAPESEFRPEPEPAAEGGYTDPAFEVAPEPATAPEPDRPEAWAGSAESEGDPFGGESESIEPRDPASAPEGDAAEEAPGLAEDEEFIRAAAQPVEMDLWQDSDRSDQPVSEGSEEETDPNRDRDEPRAG